MVPAYKGKTTPGFCLFDQLICLFDRAMARSNKAIASVSTSPQPRLNQMEYCRKSQGESKREVMSPINPVWGGYGLSFDTPPYPGPGPVKEDMV